MLGFIGGIAFLYLCLKTNHRVGLLPQNSGTLKLSLSLSLSLSLLYSKAYKIIKKSAEMNVLIRLCFIFLIGFFGANKTLNATAILSLDFGSFSMPITANFSDGALNVFKWFEKHPSVGVKVGRLANQDDTISTLVFIVIVVAMIALIAIFIRDILLNTIAVGSLIGSLWLYMVGFYYLYGVPFWSYLSGCHESCYPDSLHLLPTLMQYSPIYSIIKLLAHFNIEITLRLSFLLFGCV